MLNISNFSIHIGVVTSKDVFNQSTLLKRDKRGGRTEEDILKQIIQEKRKSDPDGSYDVYVDPASKELTVIFVESSDMKRIFSCNGEVLFFDSTYRDCKSPNDEQNVYHCAIDAW